MKNFKKVLALVLVLASLLGLATMAGAATEYKDADKINADYTEAIKVLDLIETMQGYPDGNFKPTATITREEAAKVIAIFDNKDADISTYYTSINPFADEKGRWGESYVGYGYRAGIIAGMNATTYAPTSNVTGTQFLKMALVTLGYDQEKEGFVGTSWAVNVLALAKRIGLIDDLADGWKPEHDLTREEAAQILLNALNADTVEYGQEAKLANFKPTKVLLGKKVDAEGNETDDYTWSFNGKFYVTNSGAVKTGNKLYKDFKLETTTSYDAFERPYTKWTYDKDDDKTVEVMKAPKATFTTSFNACELLVALGVKESNTKTTREINSFYINGEKADLDDYLGDTTLKHTKNPCELKDADKGYKKMGAQGTLTQVFKEKDKDGNDVYRICSIDTWLAKVEKVTKTSTSRDNHKKGNDLVLLNIFTMENDDGNANDQTKNTYNYADYCDNGNHNFTTSDETVDGKDYLVSYDDPTGLAKGDYVLVTYSFKEDKDTDEDMGIQSADVVTAKEGRLNGYKYADVATDPSETRIGGEYVKDAVHFHLGYDESKEKDSFGTRGFFYDAYGNVIGMKDAADVSKYGVLDKAWVEYNKGVASLHANIVGLDAKVTEDVVVATVKFGEDKVVDVVPDAPEAFGNKYDITVADLLSFSANGSEENYKSYFMVYDLLGKFEVNSKSEYTVSRADNDYEYGTGELTFTKGKPVLKGTDSDDKSVEIKVTSKTEFLVRTDDIGTGSYTAWTGYTGSSAKSVVAHGWDVVMDDDKEYATVVYLYDIVGFNDGKFVAYVPANANIWQEEVADDGAVYYILEAYIDGVKTELKIDKDSKKAIDEGNGTGDDVEGNFYEFRYREIGDVNTAVVIGKEGFNLADSYTVDSYKDGVLTVKENEIGETGDDTMAFAADVVIYSISKDGKVAKEDKGLEYADDYVEADRKVYIDWNDKNDDNVDKIVAIYVVETAKD